MSPSIRFRFYGKQKPVVACHENRMNGYNLNYYVIIAIVNTILLFYLFYMYYIIIVVAFYSRVSVICCWSEKL